MSTARAFIKRHPALTFYALVFAISWGGMLLVVGGPGGIPGSSEQVEKLMPSVLLALFAGPSVAGVLVTGLVSGRAGLGELLSRLVRWRVGARSSSWRKTCKVMAIYAGWSLGCRLRRTAKRH